MKKLTFQSPNTFIVNHKKSFIEEIAITNNELIMAFDFAFEMCFGYGHHRLNRTGGQNKRSKIEIFGNTFQGKLAELVLYNYFSAKNLNCSDVDLRVMSANQWDSDDLIVNERSINVKSAAFFSNLLLLEEKDWDNQGRYIPNIHMENRGQYDYFVFIRIKPDIKNILKLSNLLSLVNVEKNKLRDIILSPNWFCDIPGFLDHADFVRFIIGQVQILPKNSLLNGKTKMDASNYYLQTGNLKPMIQLIQR